MRKLIRETGDGETRLRAMEIEMGVPRPKRPYRRDRPPAPAVTWEATPKPSSRPAVPSLVAPGPAPAFFLQLLFCAMADPRLTRWEATFICNAGIWREVYFGAEQLTERQAAVFNQIADKIGFAAPPGDAAETET